MVMAIRLGIVGMGRIGTQQLTCASDIPSVCVSAVSDPMAIEQSGEKPRPRWFSRCEEMLAQAELDAVSICVPHHFHGSIARAALEAGKHVLIEKPLALTVAEARDLVELARRRERVFMVELTHRFYPPVRQAAAMVRRGRLGDIYAAEDRIVEPAGAQIQTWLTRKSTAGGGVALTNGIHMLDRIAFVTGHSLRLLDGSAGYSAALGDIEDAAAMLLSLDHGAPVQLLAAWPRGSGPGDDELTIYGTRGTLRVWAWRGWRFESSDGGALEQQDCYSADDDAAARVRVGVKAAMEEFASAILQQRAPDPSAEAALAAQELVEDFYQRAGRNKA